MKQQVFSIYDSKAQAYFPPFYLHNSQMAIRQFGDMVNDPESRVSKHPEDYTLFHLAEWDDQDSKHKTPKNSPESLGNGAQFVNGSDLSLAP